MGRSEGFTILELVVVMLIGSILIAVSAPAFGAVQRSRAVGNARDSFVWLAMRARAASIEKGEPVTLTVDPVAGKAVAVSSSGEGIDSLIFTGEIAAGVSTSTGSSVQVCYSPRGYATCPDEAAWVTFRLGSDSARALIQPLGQVDRP